MNISQKFLRPRFLALSAMLVSASFTSGAFGADFNEATDGDISDNRFAPTTLTLDFGSNKVIGEFGRSPVPEVTDLDYFTVNVPQGMIVTELFLTNLRAGGANSFLGVQAGPVMTFAPNSNDPSPLLGWAHIFNNQQNTDLLPALGLGGLASGSYTFWINETDGSDVYNYGLDFNVQAIPEPSAYAIVLSASVLLAVVARRSKIRGSHLLAA